MAAAAAEVAGAAEDVGLADAAAAQAVPAAAHRGELAAFARLRQFLIPLMDIRRFGRV